jgi:hypothetical protein
MPGDTPRRDGFAHAGGARRACAALRACIDRHKTGKRLRSVARLSGAGNVIIFSNHVEVMSHA